MAVNVHFLNYNGPAGRYRAMFRYEGNKRKSKVVQTKKEGREWAERKMLELHAEREALERQKDNLMFSLASKEYLEDCATHMTKQTVDEKLRYYTSLVTFVGSDFVMQELPITTCRQYYRHVQAEITDATANNHVKHLRALWNWFISAKRLWDNPWTAVKQNPEEEFQEYIPPEEDVVKVLLAASPWEQDYLQIILLTACRASDPRLLEWRSVNFEHEFVKFWTRKRKGGQKVWRTIDMPKDGSLYALLWRRWQNRDTRCNFVFVNPNTGEGYKRSSNPYQFMLKDHYQWRKQEDGTYKAFLQKKGLCNKVGVEAFTLKSLRHFSSIRLADSGKAGLTHIQKLLGHMSPSTTDKYLKKLRGDTSQASAVLEENDLLKRVGNGKSVTQGVTRLHKIGGE